MKVISNMYCTVLYCGFRAVIQTDSYYTTVYVQQTEQLYRQVNIAAGDDEGAGGGGAFSILPYEDISF